MDITGSSRERRGFAGKVAFVTGAGRGIGAAIALRLARAGADLVLNDLPGSLDVEQVARECREVGRRVELGLADVGDPMQVERAVAIAVERLGGLDLVVANAAYTDRGPFHEQPLEQMQRTIQVTMWGPLHVVRCSARVMIAAGSPGSMVVVSSTHATNPNPGCMAYNMAKAAVEQMVRTAATELFPYGIRVNAIRPGWVDTPGERKFFTEESIQRMVAGTPQRRLQHPDEIARGVLFLLDPDHPAANGSILTLDGGIQLPVDRPYQTA